MEFCRLRNVHMGYGREEVLHGVDLGLKRGSVVGLVGENGSGKSTLLKILAGILRPDAGTLQAPHGKPRIGYMPENCQWYPYLSGAQVLAYFARYTGASKEQTDQVLRRVGLWEARDKKVRAYSKGMRQKLGLAQAISGDPDLLILDEPTNGLDPRGIIDFYDILQERVAAGATAILSSHLLTELEGRITHIALLQGGRIATDGPCQKLIDSHGLPYRITLGGGHWDSAVLEALPQGIGKMQFRGASRRFTLAKNQLSDFFGWAAAHNIRHQDLQVQPPTLDDLYLHIIEKRSRAANGKSRTIAKVINDKPGGIPT